MIRVVTSTLPVLYVEADGFKATQDHRLYVLRGSEAVAVHAPGTWDYAEVGTLRGSKKARKKYLKKIGKRKG